MTKTLNVAVAGLGTVGSGVVTLLTEKAQRIERIAGCRIRVVAVSAKNKKRAQPIDLSSVKWVDDAEQMAIDPDVDVVVELIGGEDGIALRLCEQALKHKKHVVTANKAMLAKHGVHLAQLAEENGVTLAFEASVAGGAPVIKLIREGLAANDFTRIYGIMNGTCNYILTAMQESGREFKEVLDEAQKLGYAEADPSFDVDGIDTAHKLTLLTALAYGGHPDMSLLRIEGIRNIAQSDIVHAAELGYRIKLLGICEMAENGVIARVHPCMIPMSNAIASIDGVFNAIVLEGDETGRLMLEGRGAGQRPTASAVMADLIDIACGRHTAPFAVPVAMLRKLPNAGIDSHTQSYYFRLSVKDQPGVLAEITQLLSHAGISIESLLQKGSLHQEKGHVEIIMVTHECKEKAVMEVIKKINTYSWMNGHVNMIRIFR